MQPSFFDAVQSPSSQFNFVENYFFVPYVSPKLGFRKFEILQNSTHTDLLQEQKKDSALSWQNRCIKGIALSIQIISFCTIVIPLAIAILKLKNRKLHHYEITTPSKSILKPVNLSAIDSLDILSSVVQKKDVLSQQEVDRSTVYLQKQWDNYTALHNTYKTCYPILSANIMNAINDIKKDTDLEAWIQADRAEGNLPLACKNFVDTYFVPDTYSLRSVDSNIPHIMEPKGIDTITEHLSHAFALGKNIVVMRVGLRNPGHCLLAAFQKDGTFKIIDSMSWKRFNIQEIVNKLNTKKIINQQGNPIVFQGQYVNTCVQGGGHECVRFATLYGYQIAKTGSLEGYRAINQAFLENRLKFFQDAQTIEGCTGPENISVPHSHYKPFMHSWAYASIGLLGIQKWQDIHLSILRKHAESIYGHNGSFGCSFFTFNNHYWQSNEIGTASDCAEADQENFSLIEKEDTGAELDLPLQELLETEDCTIGELLSRYKQETLIVLATKKKIFLAITKSKPPTKVLVVAKSKDGKRSGITHCY